MIITPLQSLRIPESDTDTLRVIVDDILLATGYDFRDYSPTTLYRRLSRLAEAQGLPDLATLRERLIENPLSTVEIVNQLSVRATALFRDPAFFRTLRAEVLPFLSTYPFIRIWHVGCATGEEVLSMAILLREEGMEDRARIYATDFNESALENARLGRVPAVSIGDYRTNYIQAGGVRSLEDYYEERGGYAHFDTTLIKNVVYSPHNLVSDASFNEFQLILCRNVLIYFNRDLLNRVFGLLHESLVRLGFLGIGQRESLLFSPFASHYESLSPSARIYRKKSV